MGFETPLALIALAAAALPIIAHLLRRRDLPERRLPTVALLRRAEASSKQRVRIVDRLLLAARVLLIAFIAIAIAGPFLRVALAYGDGSRASVVIVLDDSMSVRGRETLFDAALERADAIVESLPLGSEIAIVLAGDPMRVLLSRTEDLDAAARALAAASWSDSRGTDLPAAVARAERELAGARHADRRIVVLTDMAAHARLVDLRVRSGSAVSLELEALADDPSVTNAGIVSANASEDPTTPGQISVAVEIRASEDLAGQRVPVSLLRGDTEVARTRAELTTRGARVTLHADASEETDGVAEPRAEVRIEIDDALESDDHRGVLMRAPGGARVLVVDGDPHPVRGHDEARFLSRALDLAPRAQGLGAGLTRQTVDPDTFAALDLAGFEVVILANVPTPSARTAERLTAFVTSGGGLLIAPGDHFDPRAMSARLGALMFIRAEVTAAQDLGGPRLAPGSDLIDGRGSLERTRTSQRLTFDPILASNFEVPLVFEDGTAALVIDQRESGAVAILATTVDDDWTDLPFQPGYLPLVVSLVRRLASTRSMPDRPFAAGSTVTLRAPPGATRVRISTPASRTYDFDGDDLAAPLRFDDTLSAGVYRVSVATRDTALRVAPEMAFLVAPPAEESDLTPGSPPELDPAAARGAAERRGGTVVQRPFAGWLFLLAGLLAIAEGVLRVRSRAMRLAR